MELRAVQPNRAGTFAHVAFAGSRQGAGAAPGRRCDLARDPDATVHENLLRYGHALTLRGLICPEPNSYIFIHPQLSVFIEQVD